MISKVYIGSFDVVYWWCWEKSVMSIFSVIISISSWFCETFSIENGFCWWFCELIFANIATFPVSKPDLLVVPSRLKTSLPNKSILCNCLKLLGKFLIQDGSCPCLVCFSHFISCHVSIVRSLLVRWPVTHHDFIYTSIMTLVPITEILTLNITL